MIQEVLKTTVALMNTGAQLWRKCAQFSSPEKKIKNKKNNGSSTIWCILGVHVVLISCIFDSVRSFLNSNVQTT